jgi:hypothetical protein
MPVQKRGRSLSRRSRRSNKSHATPPVPKTFRSHRRQMNSHNMIGHMHTHDTAYIFNIVFTLIINTAILYLVMEVEKAQCMQTCKLNWRHQFVKYTSILIIICKILCMFNIKGEISQFIYRLTTLMSIINIYVLYVYMQDMSDNKACTCANTEHPTLTNVVLYYSYIRIVFVSIVIISAMLIFLSGGTR